MIPVDFRAIVNRAADEIERRHSVVVDHAARELLIRRGEDHADEVTRALQSQGLSASDLEQAAERQFWEAKEGAYGGLAQV